jgi:signal transduction histidine kinase
MLHEFLTTNRVELIERCRSQVVQRRAPEATDRELEHGIPLFLDQLIKTLRMERTSEPMRSREVSGPAGGGNPPSSEIAETAARHGRELLEEGFTVEQVIHDYGDLCQAISGLAFEYSVPIQPDEFQTLNRCLDNAIAEAVTEFSYRRDALVEDKGVRALNERLGVLAHELRNLVHTATLAFTAVKAGKVAPGGATGGLLDRSLMGMSRLIDHSLAEVRLTAGMPARHQLIPLAEFIAEVKLFAGLEAQLRECGFTVDDVDPLLAIDADLDLLLAAVANLLQNAFKFTKEHTEVSLSAYAAGDRILIDVEDACGGLPPGGAEKMFLPFEQLGADKSGLGLGMSIARRSVEANNGFLRVRDLPGKGCVLTIDLPRHSLPELSSLATAP